MVALLATGGSHQPPDPLGGGGARGRHRDRLDRLLRPVGRRAAAGARLPERQRRREPVPGRRRPGLRAARAARRRLPARRRGRRSATRGLRELRATCRRCDGGALRWQRAAAGQRRRRDRAPGRRAVQRQRRPEAAAAATWAAPSSRSRPCPTTAMSSRRRRASSTAQEALQPAFKAGELERDFVAVVRFQGPRANGMPELHKLTPPLAVLQGKGFKVALVTDGRMSGASGKVPAAIHVSPEALAGGPLAKVRDGDVIRLDAVAGTLEALVDAATWAAREPAALPADAGRGQRPRPGPRTVRRHAPQRAQRRRRAPAPGCWMARSTMITNTARTCAAHGPVIPVIVLQRVERRRAAGARAGRRRRARAGGDAAHAGGAGTAWRPSPRAVPEAIVGAGTIRSGGRCAGGARRRLPLRRQPRLHRRRSARPAATSACRCCPAWPPASEVMAANADGLRLPEVLSGHARPAASRC